jgi:hypothetical protein
VFSRDRISQIIARIPRSVFPAEQQTSTGNSTGNLSIIALSLCFDQCLQTSHKYGKLASFPHDYFSSFQVGEHLANPRTRGADQISQLSLAERNPDENPRVFCTPNSRASSSSATATRA